MAANTIVDYFLKVDGVEGTSTDPDPQAKGAFEIKDFSFEVTNKTTIGSATGGAGAGKIKFNEFTIKKTSDKASPVFFKNCCTGAHYKTVTLTMRKAGGDPGTAGKPFLMVKFSDVLTSRYTNMFVKPQPDPPVDVVTAPADTIGGQIGGTIDTGPGDEGPEESIAFNYGKLDMSSNATRLNVQATAAGVASFDAATNTLKVSDAPGGVFTVGTQGGMSTRGLAEFDTAVLIGLLTNPIGARARLMVSEVREAALPPSPIDQANLGRSGPGGNQLGPSPHMHFDAIFYTPADGVLTLEDLTRPGKRIGTLTVDPRGDPTSLDVDVTEMLTQGNLGSFGIRLQLRGTPIAGLTGPGDEGPEENDLDNGRNVNASFTLNFVVDTP